MTQLSINELEEQAKRIRLEILKMFSYGKAHHFGGSLSCADIVAALYFRKMNFSIELLEDPSRDRFVMSKGHTVPTQYAALALKGIFPVEELQTIKTLGTRLQGHPDINKTPGIEAPTGSLGQGLSFANGMALGGRMNGLKFNSYVILGDGELQEGQVWEAAMTTSHYKLGSLCAFVDRNRYQSQGSIDDLMGVEPLEQKFESFGWNTVRIDGHDMSAICAVLDDFDGEGDKPLAVIADTVKGKGIPFMENTHKYHNYALSETEYNDALAILSF
jgi:transketolase